MGYSWKAKAYHSIVGRYFIWSFNFLGVIIITNGGSILQI